MGNVVDSPDSFKGESSALTEARPPSFALVGFAAFGPPGPPSVNTICAPQGNLRSIGSCLHANGTCKPCAHENKFYFDNGPPCRNGALCNFCHEDDHPNLAAMKRNMRQKYKFQRGWPRNSG